MCCLRRLGSVVAFAGGIDGEDDLVLFEMDVRLAGDSCGLGFVDFLLSS